MPTWIYLPYCAVSHFFSVIFPVPKKSSTFIRKDKKELIHLRSKSFYLNKHFHLLTLKLNCIKDKYSRITIF